MSSKGLVGRLRRAGMEPIELAAGSGGRIVLLERGARMIGMFADEASDNALWVNPAAFPAETETEADPAGSLSWNIGGERTWISPELVYFVRERERFWETYEVPPALDPGRYRTEAGGDAGREAVFAQTCELASHRTKEKLTLSIRKRVRLADDPLRRDGGGVAEAYACAHIGCEVRNEIEVVASSGTFAAPVACWAIVQVPAGGVVWVPTVGWAEADDFFAPNEAARVIVKKGMLRLALDARAQRKLSLKADRVVGVMAYCRELTGGRASLLVRSFVPDPAGDYRDAPAQRPDERGHCLQLYNDDGSLGRFGELEYHSPVIDGTKGVRSLADQSRIDCYEGERSAVIRIRDIVLGHRRQNDR